MAIREDNKKVQDNLNYKKAFREDRVKDIFPNEPIRNIRKMYDRLMKETGGRKPE